MSQQVLREKAQNIQSSVIYTIMADEIKISNKEKNGTVFCIRWVDDNLQPHKEFIGMHPLLKASADHIILVVKDILLRMNLKIENAQWKGQCYDGFSAMAGTKSRVATQLKLLKRKYFVTHC